MKLTIKRVADAAAVSIDTVRYYERTGLLEAPQRSESGYRLYRTADIERLRFIRRAKALGFTLEDIGVLLQLSKGGDRAKVRELAKSRVETIRRNIADLQEILRVLESTVRRCRGHGSVSGCPIIETLNGEERDILS